MTLLLTLLALAQQADQDFLSCDTSADGWFVLDPGGGGADAKLRVTREGPREGTGALEMAYERKANVYAVLVAPVLLTNLRAIEFDVWSREAVAFAIGVEDKDRAKFHYAVELQAGRWRRVRIAPGELQPSDDSPVKKPRLDPKRLGFGLPMVDLSPMGGVEGPNVLRIDGLRVLRDPLPAVRLPAVVDGRTVELAADGAAQGDVTVRNGGTLRISAARFSLAGSVVLEKGTLEVSGTSLSLRGRHPHDLKIVAGPQSLVRFRNATVVCNFVHGVGVGEKARLEFERTLVGTGGFTVDAREGSSVSLDQAQRTGEFVLAKGARFTMTDSDGALLWFTPSEATLKLPAGASVEHWVFPKDLGVQGSIQKSRFLSWGLLSTPGSRITVEEGALAGVGVLLSSEARISGVKNGSGADLKLEGRTLDLAKAAVAAWNFYPAEGARLELLDSTFGELSAIGPAQAVVENSTCDGTGGYLRAEGQASLTLRNCTVTCAVVATDDAVLVLEGCVVEGPLTASGRANVRLVGTKVSGPIEKLEKAVIEKK